MATLDYKIDIDVTSPSPIRAGDTVNLTATPTITHPSGVTPSVTYAWINHLGHDVGGSQSVSYVPTSDGRHYLQVSVEYRDDAEGYLRTVSQDVSLIIKSSEKASYDFGLKYTKALFASAYSNMDIYRTLSGFPAWSSASKNFFSDASKLMSPLAEPISQTLDDFDEFIENNTNHDDVVRYGYRENQYEIISASVPRMINTEYGYCEHIGPHGSRSLESAPIRVLNRQNADTFTRQTVVTASSNEIVPFAVPSVLYVSNENASLQNTIDVRLKGINEDGELIGESFTIYSGVPFETINTYKALYDTQVSAEVEISTYVDMTKHHSSENGINLQKRLAGVGGNYFDPKIEIDDKSMLVLNGMNIGRADEFKFELNHNPESIFLNNLLDVTYLKDGSVYCGKLMLDYYNLSQVNSSTNINNFINLDYDNTSIGSDVRINIKCDEIKEEFGETMVRVSATNGEDRMYLSSALQLVEEKDTWIDLSKASNYIAFSMEITNDSPYIYELELGNRSESFIAMNYLLPMQTFKVADGVKELFMYNKKLHCENTDGTFSILDPVRLAFTSGINRLYLFNNFNESELIYEDD